MLCLAFGFIDLPKKRRALMFVLSVVSCVIVKLAIDLYVRVPLPFLTMEVGHQVNEGGLYIIDNVDTLLHKGVFPFSFLLVNSGTLIGFMILPSMDRTVHSLKISCAAFIIGIWCFGRIVECRSFVEMIPFALYSLSMFSNGAGVSNKSEARAK